MIQRAWRILIIDDSPEDREAYQRFLSKDGRETYTFAEAETAEEGEELCRTLHPDCVLLDYKLPGADGLALLHSYDGSKSPPEFAVVMLTGQGDEQVAVEALKTGAQDYLVKSRLTPESLQLAVRQAIDKVGQLRQQAARRAELERQVITDGLTGLMNRQHFLERLAQELERVSRYCSVLSLLMIDVDHFKNVNDTHGHLVGDHVLVQVGKVLRSCLRSSDLAARYGGEEFCILAANTDLEGAQTFAERIRQLVAQQQIPGSEGKPFSVTCSIGVAESGTEATEALELLARADEALYLAKQRGRNRVCAVDTNPPQKKP
jgi:diguanylate cyclase (GGDEF)-like protein